MRDLSIRQAFHRLLDKGEYLAYKSTVYRIFGERDVNIRRDSTREPIKRHKPTSFEATGPNQVWSWDNTYLKDANHQQCFYYVFGERQKFCVHGIIGARQTGASNEHEHQTQFS